MSEENYKLPEDWRTSLPVEMQSSGVLENVNSIETLAKIAIDGRNFMSTALRIPSAEATPEDQSAFRNDLMTKLPDLMYKPKEDDPESFKAVMKTLGMPAEVDGYELPDIPESMKENMTSLVSRAHSAGLTKAQLKAITGGIVDDYNASTLAQTNSLKDARSELQTEWGSAYQSKVETIKHFAKQTGFSEGFIEAIESGQVDSTNMKALDYVIKGFEGNALEIGRQPNDPSAAMVPSEASSQIDEIMGNKEHAYWQPSDPAHKAAIEKVLELGRIAEAGRVLTDADKLRMALAG